MARTLGLLLNAEYSMSRLAELGELSESLGYDILWYTDLRLSTDCYLGLSVLAAHTKRVRLGPCVNDPYTRHSMSCATDARYLGSVSAAKASANWVWRTNCRSRPFERQ